MAKNKKSFVLYCDMIYTVELLEDEQAGQLLKMILAYVNDQNPDTDNLLLQVAFEPIKRQLKRDLKNYEERAQRSRTNGKLGGRPSKNPKKPSGLIKNPDEPKKPDNDNVNVNDSVINKYSIHKTYLRDIENRKDTDYGAWLDGLYGMYKLKSGTIGKLLGVFCQHLKATEKVHDDITLFKKHFANWLGKQEEKKMLNEYKTRKVGAL